MTTMHHAANGGAFDCADRPIGIAYTSGLIHRIPCATKRNRDPPAQKKPVPIPSEAGFFIPCPTPLRPRMGASGMEAVRKARVGHGKGPFMP